VEAIRRDPKFAEAYCNLGHALRGLGRFRDALVAFHRGHELGSKDPRWQHPSGEWVRQCEALATVSELAWLISPNSVRILTAVCRTEGVWRNDPKPLAEDGPMALRNWLQGLLAKHPPAATRRTRLGVEVLEDRAVPSGDFDPGSGTHTRATAGGNDAFVLKLDAAGTFAWAETFGGSGDDQGWEVAVTPTGTVHFAGSYQGSVDFDPDPLDVYELTTPGTYRSFFLVKVTQP
jgi:hypothetical protein